MSVLLSVFSLSVQVCTERAHKVTQRSSPNYWRPAPTSTAKTRYDVYHVILKPAQMESEFKVYSMLNCISDQI